MAGRQRLLDPYGSACAAGDASGRGDRPQRAHPPYVPAHRADGLRPARKPVTNPDATANVVVVLKVKPKEKTCLVREIDGLLPEFRWAAVNISFDVYQSVAQPDTMVQIERWQTAALHDANLKRPVIGKIRADFAASLSRPMLDGRLLLNDVTLT
jgi:quinol monooxygenase YgiN